MNRIILTTALLLLCRVLFAEDGMQFSGRYQVSETLKIYALPDSCIGDYTLEIVQLNDTIFEIINLNMCSDTIEALLQRDTLHINNQTIESTTGRRAIFNGYGCFADNILTFWIEKFDYLDYSNSIIACVDEDEYKKNSFIYFPKSWFVAWKGSSSSERESSSEFSFNGFTSINGIIYYYLFEDRWINNGIHRELNSLWRESDQQIFRKTSDNEELIFDTSLSPQDTLYCTSGKYSVIDSVVDNSWGDKIRKHWYVTSNNGQKEVWIDGVGNISNMSNLFCDPSSVYIPDLLCFVEDDKLVYQDPDCNSCYVSTTSNSSMGNDNELIILYPAGEGLLNVQLKNGLSGEFQLFTIEGRQLLKSKIDRTVNTINIPKKGVLIFRFINANNEIQTGKIIVN